MPELRLLSASDLQDAMRLKEAAGWNQTQTDWLNVMAVEPGGCFCIEVEGAVAATATVVCYGCELAWIGMVLTAPEYRGRGFARRLMQRAIEYARAKGVAWIKLDATDMGLPLYSSLGFESEGSIERWLRQGDGLPGERSAVDAGAGQKGCPMAALELDRAAFGADRSAIIERIASEVYEAGGEGYAMARPGTRAAYFGPCVASSAAVARELLDRFTALHAGEGVYWDLLGANPEAVRLAGEAGFEVRRKLTRMVLRGRAGAPPLGNDDSRVFGIAGFEFG